MSLQGYASHPDMMWFPLPLQEVGKWKEDRQRTQRKKDGGHTHRLRLLGAAVTECLRMGSL